MESLDAEELITFSEGLTYLQKKKNLSIKDIIEVPNLFFLSDNTFLTLEKKKLLREKNEEIIKDLEKRYEKEIFTTDFSEMDSKTLYEIIRRYVNITLEDVEIIKSNAQFWIDFFKNKKIVFK
jgi:enoyl reductase-like protein